MPRKLRSAATTPDTRPGQAGAAVAALARVTKRRVEKKKKATAGTTAAASPTGSARAKARAKTPQPRAAHPPARQQAGAGKPVIVLAHGAGTTSAHPIMQKWRRLLTAEGQCDVAMLDLPRPYNARGKLVKAHAAAVAAAQARFRSGRPIFLVGTSMGGRIGLHVVAEDADGMGGAVAGAVALSFPLVTGSGKRREEVLLQLPESARVLFVCGTRDKMCPVADLRALQPRLACKSTIHVVDMGDHGLKVLKRAALSQEDSDLAVARAVLSFCCGAPA